MPQWEGRSRGNKLGYQIFVFVCGKLGVMPAYFLLRFVAFYFVLFSPSSTRHIYSYFRQRQNQSVLRSILLVYRNYYTFGQTLLDKIIVLAGIKNNFTYHFEGEENLWRIASLKKGGILLSGHVGNWEIASQLLNKLQVKVNVVMFDGEHQQIKNYLQQVTSDRAFNVIVMRDGLSHVFEIGEALQRGEWVCMHADRFVKETKTITHPFLNSPARFPMGPFSIAAAFNAPVSFVYAFKETSHHYHFYGSKFMVRSEEESKREYANNLAGKFVSSFEKMVLEYPVQWFNYYNFWEIR
jgi:predicted LPLAT superfamily acyltransferase